MRSKDICQKSRGFFKKILSFTIALVVVFGAVLPMTVSADGETESDASLYAHLDFEDPADGVFTTKGANQKTYTLIGGAKHNPRGIDGYGVSMSTQSVGYAATENIDFTFNNGHSISMWIHGDVLSSGWTGAVLTKGTKNTAGHFEIVVSSKVFHIYGQEIGTTSLGLNCADITNGWHHLAFVWENNVIKSYVDGTLKATSAAITNIVTATNTPVYVGAVSNNSLPFTGIIDEVKLYTKAIAASEVTALAEEYEPTYLEMVGISEVGTVIEDSDFCFADDTAIQFWFNAKTFTQNQQFEYILSRGTKGQAGHFQIYTRNGNLEFYGENQDSTTSVLTNANYVKVCLSEFTGGWHMLTMVNKDSKFLFYVDGELVSSVDSSSYKPYATAMDLIVGKYGTTAFSGTMLDFELLPTAPDAAGVKAEYDKVVANLKVATLADSLYTELDFEDPVDGVFTTKGINKKTYTLTGAAIHTSRGIDGYGLATNLQAVGWATTEALDYTFNNGHSISMWIHGDVLVPGTKTLANVLLAKGPKASGHFEFYVKGGGGNVVYMYGNDIGDISLNLNISELHGGWHHLAFVWDGNVVKSYVDGTLKATSATISGTVAKTTNPIYVGNFNNTTVPFLNGTIDEVQLYTKALSEEDLKALISAVTLPKSIELDDADEVGTVIESSEFCLADGTAVRFWFNADTFTKKQKAADIFETLFSKGTKNAKGYFQFYARNGLLEFHAVNEDGTASALSNANYMKVTLSEFTGGWHMFTIVNKDSNFLVFVDDILVSTVDSSSYVPYATSDNITVGALDTAVFSGKIQRFELLNTAPDAAAIKAEYDSVVNGHKHIYDKQIATEKYLSSAATYTTHATYFKSCSCGEAGSDIFYGEVKAIAISGSNLTVGKDLTMNFYLPKDITPDIKIRATMNGEPVILDGEMYGELYKFSYKGIAPQCMGDGITVEAVVVDENNAVTRVLVAETDHGITAYFNKLLAKTATELGISEEKYAVMKTLIADILNYGAAAQNYKGYKTDALVNEGVTGGTAFEALTTTDMSITGTALEGVSFYSATVYYDNTNKLYFRLKAEDLSGLCVVIKRGDSIEKVVLSSEFIAETNGQGETVYSIYSHDIYATDFDAVFTSNVYRQTADQSVEGQSLTYSVNSYVYSKQNDGEGELSETAQLARAMYCYGVSSETYYSMN